MEFENILEEPKKIKVRKKFVIPLVIIAILLIGLVGIFGFLYLNVGSAKDIYFSVLDNTNEFINESLDEAKEIIENPLSIGGDLKIDMVTNDLEMKELVEILNNVDLSYKIETDYKEKKANYDLDATYEDGNLINLGLNVKNDEVFVNLGSLFNKDIRFSGEDTEIVWNVYDYDNYKIIVDEAFKELKNVLKDEYFSTGKELVKINDKNVFTSKYTIDLSGKDIYDIEISLYDNLKNNDKYLEAFAKMSGISKNEVINELNSYRNEVVQDDSMSLKITTYVNLFSKKIVKVSIDDSGSITNIVYSNKNSYDILEENSIVGSLEIKDDLIKLEYNYGEDNIVMEITEDDFNFNYGVGTNKINLNMTMKADKYSYLCEIVVKEDEVDAKISIDGVMENVTNITEKINNNYVDYDKLSDEDYMNMYQGVYQNQTLMTFIQDLSSIEDSSNSQTTPMF